MSTILWRTPRGAPTLCQIVSKNLWALAILNLIGSVCKQFRKQRSVDPCCWHKCLFTNNANAVLQNMVPRGRSMLFIILLTYVFVIAKSFWMHKKWFQAAKQLLHSRRFQHSRWMTFLAHTFECSSSSVSSPAILFPAYYTLMILPTFLNCCSPAAAAGELTFKFATCKECSHHFTAWRLDAAVWRVQLLNAAQAARLNPDD